MKQFEIAAIPGDGVGKEVVAAAEKVLQTAAEVHGGLSFSFTAFPWSCDYYLEHGKMMPEDGIHTLTQFEAVFWELSEIRSWFPIIYRYGGCC